MKPYNNFKKTANKKSLSSEKLTDLKNWYKSSKYNYKPRFFLSINSSSRKAPINHPIFKRHHIHFYYYMNPTAANLEKQLI